MLDLRVVLVTTFLAAFLAAVLTITGRRGILPKANKKRTC
jgi:hypothetical protein